MPPVRRLTWSVYNRLSTLVNEIKSMNWNWSPFMLLMRPIIYRSRNEHFRDIDELKLISLYATDETNYLSITNWTLSRYRWIGIDILLCYWWDQLFIDHELNTFEISMNWNWSPFMLLMKPIIYRSRTEHFRDDNSSLYQWGRLNGYFERMFTAPLLDIFRIFFNENVLRWISWTYSEGISRKCNTSR